MPGYTFTWKTLIQSFYPGPCLPGPDRLFAPIRATGARLWLDPGPGVNASGDQGPRTNPGDMPSVSDLRHMASEALAILTYQKFLPGYFHDASVTYRTNNWNIRVDKNTGTGHGDDTNGLYIPMIGCSPDTHPIDMTGVVSVSYLFNETGGISNSAGILSVNRGFYHATGSTDLRSFFYEWISEWRPSTGMPMGRPTMGLGPGVPPQSGPSSAGNTSRYIRAVCDVPDRLIDDTVGLRFQLDPSIATLAFQADLQYDSNGGPFVGNVGPTMCAFGNPADPAPVVTLGSSVAAYPDYEGIAETTIDQSSPRVISQISYGAKYGILAPAWTLEWPIVRAYLNGTSATLVCDIGAAGPAPTCQTSVVIPGAIWQALQPGCWATYLGLEYSILSVTIDRGTALVNLQQIAGTGTSVTEPSSPNLRIRCEAAWLPDQYASVNPCIDVSTGWVVRPGDDSPWINRYSRLKAAKLVHGFRQPIQYWTALPGITYSAYTYVGAGYNQTQLADSIIGAQVPCYADGSQFLPLAPTVTKQPASARNSYWNIASQALARASKNSDVLEIALGRVGFGQRWVALVRQDGSHDYYEAKQAFINQSFGQPSFTVHPLLPDGTPAPADCRYVTNSAYGLSYLYVLWDLDRPSGRYYSTMSYQHTKTSLCSGLVDEIYDNGDHTRYYWVDSWLPMLGGLTADQGTYDYVYQTWSYETFPGPPITSNWVPDQHQDSEFVGHAAARYNYSASGVIVRDVAENQSFIDLTAGQLPYKINGYHYASNFISPANGYINSPPTLQDSSGTSLITVAQTGSWAFDLSLARVHTAIATHYSSSPYANPLTIAGAVDLFSPFQPPPLTGHESQGSSSSSPSARGFSVIRPQDSRGFVLYGDFNDSQGFYGYQALTDGVPERAAQFNVDTGGRCMGAMVYQANQLPRGLWAFNRTNPAIEIENTCVMQVGQTYRIASPLIGLVGLKQLNPEVGALGGNMYTALRSGQDCVYGTAQGIEVVLPISIADAIPTTMTLPAKPTYSSDTYVAFPGASCPGHIGVQDDLMDGNSGLRVDRGKTTLYYNTPKVTPPVPITVPPTTPGPQQVGVPKIQSTWPLYQVQIARSTNQTIVTSSIARRTLVAWVIPDDLAGSTDGITPSLDMSQWGTARPTWKPIGPFPQVNGVLAVPDSAWRAGSRIAVYDELTGLRATLLYPNPFL